MNIFMDLAHFYSLQIVLLAAIHQLHVCIFYYMASLPRGNYHSLMQQLFYSLSPAIFCLSEVRNDLERVKHKWNSIGVQLKIPYYKLREFESQRDSLTEVVNYWMCGNVEDVPVNWESLVAVLKTPQVGERGLAKEIQEKYSEYEESTNEGN